MNLNTWIEKKFNTKNYTLEKTDKGISNHNYLLTINDNKYMVRVPKKNHESLGLQHAHEKEIIACTYSNRTYYPRCNNNGYNCSYQ